MAAALAFDQQKTARMTCGNFVLGQRKTLLFFPFKVLLS